MWVRGSFTNHDVLFSGICKFYFLGLGIFDLFGFYFSWYFEYYSPLTKHALCFETQSVCGRQPQNYFTSVFPCASHASSLPQVMVPCVCGLQRAVLGSKARVYRGCIISVLPQPQAQAGNPYTQ